MEQNSYSKKVVEEIMNLCRDNDNYPFVINKGYGLDFVLPGCPDIKVREPREYIVKLKIKTWVGLCCEASHYYGTLVANSPELYMVGESGKTFFVGGYVSDLWSRMAPSERKFINTGYKIEVCRRITEYDIKKHPDRFGDCDAGEKTSAFYTINTLVHYAKRIAKVRFPEYRFVINDLYQP